MHNQKVRRLATLVGLILLLSGAWPVLACVTGGAMSHVESDCCRSMHGDCGDMAKTGCCRVEAKSDVQPQMASSGPSVDAPQPVVAPMGISFVPQLHRAAVVSRKFPDEHSPPGLIVARIANLRI